MNFPLLYSPCWVDTYFAVVPIKLTSGGWIWLRRYFRVRGYFPFVDMGEYEETIFTSLNWDEAHTHCDKTNLWKTNGEEGNYEML